MESLPYIAAAVVLIGLNGFFVLAEFAIVKVRGTRIEQLARDGNRRAVAALDVIRHLDEYLSATQLGITISSIGLGFLGEPAFARLFEGLLSGVLQHAAAAGVAMALAFIWVTFLHVVLGELAPKSVAIRKAEAATLFSATPLRIFHRIFIAPLWLLNGASNLVLRLIGIPPVKGIEAIPSEEELRLVLMHSQKAGVMSFNRLLLVESAFDLGETLVQDVMVPMEKAAVIDLSRPAAELRALITQRRLTRYPVIDKPGAPMENFLNLKEVALSAIETGVVPEMTRHVRPVAHLRGEMPLEMALREMQRRRIQFAIVDDYAGKPVGVLSLEDILEEIVGDIGDEFEPETPVRMGTMLTAEQVLLDPYVPDTRVLIDRMIDAARRLVPTLDIASALSAIWKREDAMPLVLEEGVTMPHARLAGLERPVVVFARVREGLRETRVGAPLNKMFFLVLTPSAPAALHNRVLQQVAQVIASEFVLYRLMEAKTPQECVDILTIGDASAHV